MHEVAVELREAVDHLYSMECGFTGQRDLQGLPGGKEVSMVLQAEKALLSAMEARDLRYVYSTGVGYRIDSTPHPSNQGHVRVERDGKLTLVVNE